MSLLKHIDMLTIKTPQYIVRKPIVLNNTLIDKLITASPHHTLRYQVFKYFVGVAVMICLLELQWPRIQS
jgi:hypothetical protein